MTDCTIDTAPRQARSLGQRRSSSKSAAVIPIDRGIPLPPPTMVLGYRAARRPYAYPWTEMEVGDSFVYPESINIHCTQRKAWSNVRYRHDRWPERYAARTVDEDGRRVVRVWRIA